MADDPFGTGALRARVLQAWTAAPARFREDANAEEELAVGAYRDRLVVELAQNAADAAARVGGAGRLLLRLQGRELRAANTGAALDAAGVEALSTLRASAKRDDASSVGRFGVGFAAVRAVADEAAITSTSGGVRWSARLAREEVARVPGLRAELSRRAGQVPMLRLPFAAAADVPLGYDSEVVLGLRDDAAVELVRRQLDEVDDVLLLALPTLTEILVEVDGRRRSLRAARSPEGLDVEEDGESRRWRVARSSGALAPALLAERPVEERHRRQWSLLWAVPLDSAGRPVPGSFPRVVYAPTRTAEPLELPALLIGTFPLDSGRRSVVSGPLLDLLVEQAGQLYAGLLASLVVEADGAPEVLDLVPGPVPAGVLDAAIRAAATGALAETPFVPAGAGDRPPLRPRDVVLVEGADPGLLGALADVLPGLPAASWSRRWPVLARLGARRVHLADVVDALAGLQREPERWRDLYAGLAHADPEALAALPVPLSDGRLVRGPRGLLLPDPSHPLPAGVEALGVQVVHAAAAHPLLERLGARPAAPAALLFSPTVRAAIDASLDAGPEQAEAVAAAVLGLVAAAGPETELPEELAGLALPDEDGELAPAAELVLPASTLAALLEPGAVGLVAPHLVERWGTEVLARVGVLRDLAVVRATDVEVDPAAADHDLDAEDEWLDELAGELPDTDLPAVLPELTAVRDLDLVRADAWPEALRLLAAPPLRAVVVEPAFAVLPDGTRVPATSYTAWWLREHPVLGGHRPLALRDPGGDPLLSGLYDDAPPVGLDPAFARALGLRTTLAALLGEPGGADDLLDRLTDPRRVIGRGQLQAVYVALAGVDPDDATPRDLVRVADGASSRLVPAAAACVLDAPHLAQLSWEVPPVTVPVQVAAPLAEVLALPLASELRDPVPPAGTASPVPDVVRRVLPSVPARWQRHDRLVIDGEPVDWWVEGAVEEARVHATGTDGLARGLAWAAGVWERRLLVAAVLADPARVEALLSEADLDGR